jgi:hypothetical protein
MKLAQAAKDRASSNDDHARRRTPLRGHSFPGSTLKCNETLPYFSGLSRRADNEE